MVEAISLVYEARGLTLPLGLCAHSTRAVASSQAVLKVSSLENVCAAAGWSSPSTFIKFYSLDMWTASGSRVLSVWADAFRGLQLRYVRRYGIEFPGRRHITASKWPKKGNISVTYVTIVPWVGNEMLRWRPFRTLIALPSSLWKSDEMAHGMPI